MPDTQKHLENTAFLNLKDLFSGRETKVLFSASFPFESPIDSVRITEKAAVHGTVSDYSGVLQFQAEFSVTYKTECDRCLKEIFRTLTFALDRPVTKVYDEDSEEETVCAENDTIDLSDLLAIGMCENFPLKHLCSADCKGLCLYCGADLNETACSCKAPPDPRLAGLAEFFHE